MRLITIPILPIALFACVSTVDADSTVSWCSQGDAPISPSWQRLSEHRIAPVSLASFDSAIERLRVQSFVEISPAEASRLSYLDNSPGMRYYLVRGAVSASVDASRDEIVAGANARTIAVHWLPDQNTIGIVAFNFVQGAHREYNIPMVLATQDNVRHSFVRCVSYD